MYRERRKIPFFKEFVYGLSKPIIDGIISIGIYAFTMGYMEIQNTFNNLNESISNVISLFTVIFMIVSIFREIIWGFITGFDFPLKVSYRSLGIIIGVLAFYGILEQIYSIIGESMIQVIASIFVVCISSILGIMVREQLTD